MEETYISFETAKLAKEKGFNINTHYAFVDLSPLDDKVERGWYTHAQNHNERDYRYSCPSQSILQKWLREEHGIHIVVIPTVTASWTYKTVTVLSKRDNDVISGLISVSDLPPYKEVCGEDFLTYEDALENAEFEALKLIK